MIKKQTQNIEKSIKKYRGGVVSLLYLVKNSQPELSNAVRELSKRMDKKIMTRIVYMQFST